MPENPLKQLETAAKSAVQTVVDWSYGTRLGTQTNQGGKTDPIFKRQPLDVLRRAAFHNVFETLFNQVDDFPFVNPDKNLKNVIKKLANNIFPRGTTFRLADKENKPGNDLLLKILKDVKFQLKTETIVNEAALMGYCGIRTVYDEFIDQWIYEVKPKEYLVIETSEGNPEDIIALGLEWPVTRMENGKQKRYWAKERWTNLIYQTWPLKPEGVQGKPKFDPEDAITEDNNYGEIPITLVPHEYDPYCFGKGVVNEEEVMTVKSLIRLHHKRHYGHLKYMDPNPIIKNRSNPGEPVNMAIGVAIDIQAADEKMPVDMTLLEFAGMPDSVKDEFYDHVKDLYGSAGLKAPPKEDLMKTGGVETPGIALRLLGKDDADTIETLRDNGYSQVIRHFEKMLRMGANLGLTEYSAINPENELTWEITAKFPCFFPPTDDEIAIKLANMKAAQLPPEVVGPMIAALFGIDDEETIRQIINRLDQKEEEERTVMMAGIGDE